MKQCKMCGEVKNTTEYNRHRETKDGFQNLCRSCQSARFKAWRLQNLERQSERFRTWLEENREHRTEYDRGRYQRDPHVSARRLIQRQVATGRMPAASDQPCHDCGQPATDYDHHEGYEGSARYSVQPVCKACHQNRTNTRKELVL